MPELDNSEDSTKPEGAPAIVSEADEKLLKQIRDDYRFCLDYWRKNREESAIDMDYAAGSGWTADDIADRENRPCLWPDELSQYVKQANNNMRQNKSEIQVKPKGQGATDEDALRRENIIRAIQYSSSAQAAYTTAFESAAWCAFGAFRVIQEEVPSPSGKQKYQQPRIKRIPNAMTVLFDPQAKESDFSDQEICFVTDSIRKKSFARKYPNAEKTSFSNEDSQIAPDWFHAEDIVIAEYWTRDVSGKKPKVMQYITNGVEILERNEWPGSWIPIIGVFGEELYTNDGGQSKRMFLSMIRRARVPQKMLAYIASQQAEEFGMSPRVPLFIWEGQEMADKVALDSMNKVAYAYIRLKPVKDEMTGNLLPPPTRQPFIPNAEAYEVARESWRRAIASAIGALPLPTQVQRQNEKSGIALEKIQNQEATAWFHLTDNYYRALENAGRQLNELITLLLDTPRFVAAMKPNGDHELLGVGTAQHGAPEGVEDYLISDRGEFDVTISEGSSAQSEREAQQDFGDKLLTELAPLAQVLPPGVIPKLVAGLIKLRNIGPEGDAIAELLDPPNQGQPTPEQLQQQVQTLTAQLQEAGVLVQKLQQEHAGHVIQAQKDIAIAQMEDYSESARFAIEQQVKILIAEIETKAQSASERATLFNETQTEMHQAAHEVGLQKDQQAHEQGMAQQAQAAAAQQQQQAGAQQSGQSAQDHQQAMAAQAAQPQNESA